MSTRREDVALVDPPMSGRYGRYADAVLPAPPVVDEGLIQEAWELMENPRTSRARLLGAIDDLCHVAVGLIDASGATR